jgi:aspartyl-tRNA(Asn)/glutamyl-tRNA(Gln) amidotransferase subunit A
MPMSLVPDFESTLRGQSLAIQGRRTTCREVFDRCRSAVAEHEPNVKAWVSFGGDDVEQTIANRDAELQRGTWRGPLHGIPIGVKDIYDVGGLPTLAGIPNRASPPADSDSTMVRRLRDAGAIIVGKTMTTPYAFFDPPPTRNPWNLDRTPGGSSSGSAAAVASGMCLGALGSQTGGSIIRPAAFCGIAGYKPTFGLLSRRGMFPFAPSLDHPGPMGRSVDDLIVMMTAMAPRRRRLQFRALLSAPIDEGIEICERIPYGECWSNALRMTWLQEGFDAVVEPIMSEALEDTLRHFAGCGSCAGRTYSDHLDLPKLWRSHRTVMSVEIALSQSVRLRECPEEFTPAVRALIEEGESASSRDYAAALQHQRDLRIRMRRAIGQEIWLTPASRGPAPTPETTGDPCMNSPWSFLGFPTITIPMAMSPDGLPLGLQMIAGPGRDFELFRAARWCEAALART